MADERHFLVEKGELDSVLAELTEKQVSVIQDIEKCIPLLRDSELIKKLEKQKAQAEAQLAGLRAGFVPLVGGYFWDIDTKSRWTKQNVREVVGTMPEEVKAIMEHAKESGIFDKIKVSGSRRGDPMLVGSIGRTNFLLAMWCNLAGDYAIGFTARMSK